MPCSSTLSKKKGAVTLLPTGRPCMSGKQTMIVSTDPVATRLRSSDMSTGGVTPGLSVPSCRSDIGRCDATVHHESGTLS